MTKLDRSDPLSALIMGRRSIRIFSKEPLTGEIITRVLTAGMSAPSACAKDPWRFVVVNDPQRRAEIAQGLPNGRIIADAAVGIVVCGDISAVHDGQISYLLQDCSAAIQNMLLAAHGLGFGACWLGVHPREDRIRHLTDLLNLPQNIIPISCVALGIPGEEKEPRSRYREEYVHREKW